MKLINPGLGRREGESLDWKTVAPRWLLLAIILLGSVALGVLLTKVVDSASNDQRRLESAIADVPSKYQARLSERVATNEAQIAAQDRAIASLIAETKKQAEATSELATQIKLLTQEIRRNR
jgi:uncharacterized coiled-coil protein SlyX